MIDQLKGLLKEYGQMNKQMKVLIEDESPAYKAKMNHDLKQIDLAISEGSIAKLTDVLIKLRK